MWFFGGGGNHTVGGGAQCGGPVALLEHSAFPDDRTRAEFADLGAVDPDAEHPVEQEVDVVAGLALLGEQAVSGQIANGGLGTPRMMVAESCRSRAVSATVTSGWLSSCSQGLCRPGTVRSHWPKSAGADLAASWPRWS
jgi:hypothetical protein